MLNVVCKTNKRWYTEIVDQFLSLDTVFTPQPLRTVQILLSPLVFSCAGMQAGDGENLVWALSHIL